jgi:hypothetical protein
MELTQTLAYRELDEVLGLRKMDLDPVEGRDVPLRG